MADHHTSVKQKPTVVSEEFRRFAADTFGLRVNNNSAQITFSLETADAQDNEIILREATAVLTLQSLKVLQIVLTNAMAGLEKQFGPITLAPGKEDQLKKLTERFHRPAKGKSEGVLSEAVANAVAAIPAPKKS